MKLRDTKRRKTAHQYAKNINLLNCRVYIVRLNINCKWCTTFTRFKYNAFSMVKYSLIDHPVEVVKNWKEQFDALKTVYKENEELNKIIASQDMYKAELDEKDENY